MIVTRKVPKIKLEHGDIFTFSGSSSVYLYLGEKQYWNLCTNTKHECSDSEDWDSESITIWDAELLLKGIKYD